MAAYAHLTGHSIPTAIGTGFTVMDKNNIDDPEVAKFVYSELSPTARRLRPRRRGGLGRRDRPPSRPERAAP